MLLLRKQQLCLVLLFSFKTLLSNLHYHGLCLEMLSLKNLYEKIENATL